MSSKKIVILFDLLIPPPRNHDYSKYLKEIEWEAEKSVFTAFKKLGDEPVLIGVFNNLQRLRDDFERIKPDFIFNLAEAFCGKRNLESKLVRFIEKTGIPFSGNSSKALTICKDKGEVKKLLQKAKVLMPKGIIVRKNLSKKFDQLQFPLFVKPSSLESSEGISKKSIVYNLDEATKRVSELKKKYSCSILVEEFIPGKELYVSALETNGNIQILPIRELYFQKLPGGADRFATYQTKWNEKFRKRFRIQNGFAHGLTSEQINQIHFAVKKAFKILNLRSYARFDFRLNSNDGRPYLLEVNPNPSLSSYDDFARSAKRKGLMMTDLVQLLAATEMSHSALENFQPA